MALLNVYPDFSGVNYFLPVFSPPVAGRHPGTFIAHNLFRFYCMGKSAGSREGVLKERFPGVGSLAVYNPRLDLPRGVLFPRFPVRVGQKPASLGVHFAKAAAFGFTGPGDEPFIESAQAHGKNHQERDGEHVCVERGQQRYAHLISRITEVRR